MQRSKVGKYGTSLPAPPHTNHLAGEERFRLRPTHRLPRLMGAPGTSQIPASPPYRLLVPHRGGDHRAKLDGGAMIWPWPAGETSRPMPAVEPVRFPPTP